MSYASIKAALVTVVQGVTQLQSVYDYDAPLPSGYPSAMVSNLSHQGAFNDTAANRRTYSFMVRLYHPISDSRNQEAETILTDAVDALIAAIEANVTLSGACTFTTPTQGKWGYQDRELPVRVVEVQVDCYTRVLR